MIYNYNWINKSFFDCKMIYKRINKAMIILIALKA